MLFICFGRGLLQIATFITFAYMNRRSAIIRMALIERLAILLLLIALCFELFYFNSSHGFYALFGSLIYIYLLGRYINKMFNDINRDYPKEENSN